MIQTITIDKMNNYHLYSSSAIESYYKQVKFDTNQSYNNFTKLFGNTNKWPKANNATFGYYLYNIFQLTSGSKVYFDILNDLRTVIFNYLNDNNLSTNYVWFQAWLNYHAQDQVLNWHKHYDCACSGYIAVDPKNTTTEFRNFSIENKIGQIYIGPIELEHRVVVNEPYIGERTTIGFDVAVGEFKPGPKNLGWMPLLK